jgi:tRNA modification GTPase
MARLTATNTVVLLNKTDLLGDRSTIAIVPPGLPTVGLSALTGDGLEGLTDRVVALADAFRQDQGVEIIAINARHADALRRARECLETARLKIVDQGAVELLASDIRGALDAFGEIAGKIDNERMLDHLFKTFCIGK